MVKAAIDVCQILALSSQVGPGRPFCAEPVGFQALGVRPGGVLAISPVDWAVDWAVVWTVVCPVTRSVTVGAEPRWKPL